jgi:hypothetical protein
MEHKLHHILIRFRLRPNPNLVKRWTGSSRAYLGHSLNYVGVPCLHGLEHLAKLHEGGFVRHAGLEGTNVSEALCVPVLAIIKTLKGTVSRDGFGF